LHEGIKRLGDIDGDLHGVKTSPKGKLARTKQATPTAGKQYEGYGKTSCGRPLRKRYMPNSKLFGKRNKGKKKKRGGGEEVDAREGEVAV